MTLSVFHNSCVSAHLVKSRVGVGEQPLGRVHLLHLSRVLCLREWTNLSNELHFRCRSLCIMWKTSDGCCKELHRVTNHPTFADYLWPLNPWQVSKFRKYANSEIRKNVQPGTASTKHSHKIKRNMVGGVPTVAIHTRTSIFVLSRMVLRRCAMVRTVHSAKATRMVAWMRSSVSRSTAAVASSSTRILVFPEKKCSVG